jgi:D-serine deaminase-like pyridoxal phosphate-dependent protein
MTAAQRWNASPLDPGGEYERLRRAIAGERLPCALVDLDAFDRNLDRTLARVRGRGKTLRLATKSIRSPALFRRIFERGEGIFRGLLCYSAAEAGWLAAEGFDDLLVAYPTIQAGELAALAGAAAGGRRVRIVVDCEAHLEALARAARERKTRLEAVIEVDPSWRPLRLAHLGARRSPVRTPEGAAALARAARRLGDVAIAGILGYESFVAGVPDEGPAAPAPGPLVRFLKRRAAAFAARLRAETVAALRAEGCDLALVNGGGSGSIETTALDPVVTEIAVGSSFFAPHLFDGYRGLALAPAAFFACEVVRAPALGLVTVGGGGYCASGAAGPSRLPRPWLPSGLALLSREGAGEVQTPLSTRRCSAPLRPGDPVFFRHAKAGEPAERFAEYVLVRGSAIAGRAPTYRGLGRCFL